MAQRLAVLLAVASILIIACAADEAATYKYEKKSHSKHEKYDKPEHKEYKPEHKEYKPEHKEYNSEGYKPDGYKPDSYKPGYGDKQYEHYGEHAYPHYEPKPYEHYSGYAPPSYGYESYGEPSPYDGGYYGGANGRQIIHLQAIYGEGIVNTTLVDGRALPALVPCAPDDTGAPNGECDQDFGVICAWRHHESDYYSNGDDYASGKYGAIFQTTPSTPVAIGKGYVKFEYFNDQPWDAINLVTFNKHQIGYKIGAVNGYIDKFPTSASACHPLLGPDTFVNFYDQRVPGYLIFGKVKLPVDPSILVPLGGLGYISGPRTGAKSASVQGVSDTEGYKTTPEGNKYKVDKDTVYLYNGKEDTLCGLTLVARGPVKVTAPSSGEMPTTQTYTGTLEWPIAWTDLVTTLPLLIDDPVERQSGRQIPISTLVSLIGQYLIGPNGGEVFALYLEQLLDRVAAVCKANSDIPWITPGSITLDVTRQPSA